MHILLALKQSSHEEGQQQKILKIQTHFDIMKISSYEQQDMGALIPLFKQRDLTKIHDGHRSGIISFHIRECVRLGQRRQEYLGCKKMKRM